MGVKDRQIDKVEEWLRHKPITAMQAYDELGIYRLAAAIEKLRRRGMAIKTEIIEVENRLGEACHVAQYTLQG